MTKKKAKKVKEEVEKKEDPVPDVTEPSDDKTEDATEVKSSGGCTDIEVN